ncbi:MAG: molecular chaperone [Cyanobacteria bacterium P01_A01_bin.83]
MRYLQISFKLILFFTYGLISFILGKILVIFSAILAILGVKLYILKQKKLEPTSSAHRNKSSEPNNIDQSFEPKEMPKLPENNMMTNQNPATRNKNTPPPLLQKPERPKPTDESVNVTNQTTQPPDEKTQPTNEKTQEVKRFPGWFAIDFGTSNSTVTLFDPKEVTITDILPQEQETRLFELLAQWLSLPANEALPGVSPEEWNKFINEIGKSLEIEPPSDVHKVFKGGSKEQSLEAIRQIELCLGKTKEFRQAVSKKLYQIYHQVFRIPALRSQSLFPIVLDMNTGSIEIPSELEITNLSPLEIEMSTRVKINRNNAIAQQQNGSLSEIISKFHHSPKRYFGQDKEFQVTVDGTSNNIKVNQLVQAAWAQLIELTKRYRENAKRRFSIGDFKTAVVTYPTIAPPIVRKQVKQLVEKLGIDDVQTAYDEAVAVVMFFLWREFGGYMNIGIESFKTRCRREGNKWSQNVLVVDIGGGTTDIALIKLTLSDITPSFKNDKERGLGGRYYEITPKLLGSSGHLQLGGELITLRIFRLLKVAIADSVLSAIATGEKENDKFNSSTLDERFLEGNKYKQGSLLKCIDKDYPENDSIAYKDALDTAEKVIPTRWKNAPGRLQTFYTLWDHAEKAKIDLGQKPQKEGFISNFILTEQDISELLNQVDINTQNQPSLNNLRVEINREQFERAAYSVIKESVSIAKGLMESRLADNEDNNDDYNSEEDITEEDDTQPKKTETEKVDWLILSGKTCNLNLVEREIYQQFSQSDYFVWNPERITFDPKFTKQGTSAGACYAENMRRLKFSPEDAKPLLRKGANQLRINVQNLFYYLPCNFKRKTQDESLLPIFNAGTELYQISPKDEVAKVRTQWLGIQLSNIIYRQDYEKGALQFWGDFNGNKLCSELKHWMPEITERWFEEHIKIQFEIDSMLNINILLCQGEPHYLIDGDGINVKKVIENEQKSNTQEEQESNTNNIELFSEGKLQWDVYVYNPEKELKNGDIAVNVLESAILDKQDAYHMVFEVVFRNLKDDTQTNKDDTKNLKKFHHSNNSQPPLNGLISEPLPNFPVSGKHTFYICDIDAETKEKKWLRIGELDKPDVSTELPCQYRASLDENGILRIHAGEVPYLEAESKEGLKEEGSVFRAQLELQPNEVNIERDPFSGTH